jgi:hypothetical protein
MPAFSQLKKFGTQPDNVNCVTALCHWQRQPVLFVLQGGWGRKWKNDQERKIKRKNLRQIIF